MKFERIQCKFELLLKVKFTYKQWLHCGEILFNE